MDYKKHKGGKNKEKIHRIIISSAKNRIGLDEILNFILVFALSFMTVRMYHRVIGTFFSELVNNGFLRKYLFGQNNAKR